MSSTRHAEPSSPLSQERYLSSPEYAELRGISGNAVTTKAALLAHPQKRSLLFFLQAMSLADGGLPKFCRDFLSMFHDRLGSPTMHRLGDNGGSPYSVEDTKQIVREVGIIFAEDHEDHDQLVAERARKIRQYEATGIWEEPLRPERKERQLPHSYFVEVCKERADQLPAFIIELCINPRVQFLAPDEDPAAMEREAVSVQDAFEGQVSGRDFRKAELRWFKDIIGALFECQRRHVESIRQNFVMTTIGRQVFADLDFCLATRKMVLIEGNSRIGKTTAAEAWCNLHLGEARFITLSGINHKTGFFRAVAKALGLGSSYARTSTEMQARIEDLLQRSKIMLVIDEAHALFSAAERVYSRPELIDWVDTALYNHGIPCALCATPQFRLRLARVEKQTTWNGAQNRGRIKRCRPLPAKPTMDDLLAVAAKLLPGSNRDTIECVVGYAISTPIPFPALVDSIDEARQLARMEEREDITFADMHQAVKYASASLNYLSEDFDSQLRKRRGRKNKPAPERDEVGESPETDDPPKETFGQRTNLPGVLSGQPSPAGRRAAVPSPRLRGTAAEVQQ